MPFNVMVRLYACTLRIQSSSFAAHIRLQWETFSMGIYLQKNLLQDCLLTLQRSIIEFHPCKKCASIHQITADLGKATQEFTHAEALHRQPNTSLIRQQRLKNLRVMIRRARFSQQRLRFQILGVVFLRGKLLLPSMMDRRQFFLKSQQIELIHLILPYLPPRIIGHEDIRPRPFIHVRLAGARQAADEHERCPATGEMDGWDFCQRGGAVFGG